MEQRFVGEFGGGFEKSFEPKKDDIESARRVLNPRRGETILDEESSDEEQEIKMRQGTDRELWNRDKKKTGRWSRWR